jgi:excisionase family DNA binding protein
MPMTGYMTTEQVADYLAVPVNTLYQWRSRGFGPRAARVGRHLRWKRDDVDAWMTARAETRPS